MTEDQAILELRRIYDINEIYAHNVYSHVDKSRIVEDASRIISEKPKPFVKWVGGKRQLLKQFYRRNLYPPKSFNPKTGKYFEPFLGGGAVFFDLLPKRAILSDLNNELVVTYNVIKNDVESLIHALEKHKLDKEYFLNIRTQDPKKLSELGISSRFIYLNRTCFNGMYRVNKSGGFNVPYGKYINPHICDEINLRKVSIALKNTEILQQDYGEVLKKAKKGDFIYFDPPYYPVSKTASFTSYTSEGFLEKEQIELRDVFSELHRRGCFLMLSNSDTRFIKEIYSVIKGVKLTQVEAGRAINSVSSKRGKIKELLVINY